MLGVASQKSCMKPGAKKVEILGGLFACDPSGSGKAASAERSKTFMYGTFFCFWLSMMPYPPPVLLPPPRPAPSCVEVGGYCCAGSGDSEHSGERDDSLELPRVGARDPEGAHGAGVGGGCLLQLVYNTVR